MIKICLNITTNEGIVEEELVELMENICNRYEKYLHFVVFVAFMY